MMIGGGLPSMSGTAGRSSIGRGSSSRPLNREKSCLMRSSLISSPFYRLTVIFILLFFTGCVAAAQENLTETAEPLTDPAPTTESSVILTLEPTEASPTTTSEPTIDPLLKLGGFVENAVNVASLPEYELPYLGGD